MAIFGPKPCVFPFGRMSFFRLFDLLVFIAQKGVFSLQNIIKPFSLPILPPPQKKLRTMEIFAPKPWIKPFGKKSILDCLNFLFYSLERRFFVLEYNERHFPGLYCLYCLFSPFEKCQFFDFLTFLFLQPRKAFFRSTIS